MDRAEQTGLGIAVVGHAALFALLSATFLGGQVEPPSPPPMDVSLVDEVALTAASPNRDEVPPPSIAPESGPPEDAAPPASAPAPAAPEPAPPVPKPAPAPPPRPAPVAKPQPRQPAPPAPAKSIPVKPAPQPATRTPARPAKPTQGTQVAATSPRQRGAILGSDFLKGLTADRTPTQARGEAPRAPTMSAQAAADIGSAIQRQVQPCAERQQLNAPGAERIRVDIRLNLNRDGSLAARPAVVGHTGVDDDNDRYVKRVDDLAIAAFVGCAPLRGLPADLYDVPRGWKVFRLRFKLPS